MTVVTVMLLTHSHSSSWVAHKLQSSKLSEDLLPIEQQNKSVASHYTLCGWNVVKFFNMKWIINKPFNASHCVLEKTISSNLHFWKQYKKVDLLWYTSCVKHWEYLLMGVSAMGASSHGKISFTVYICSLKLDDMQSYTELDPNSLLFSEM